MTRPTVLGVLLGASVSALAVWTSPTGRWLRGSPAAAPEPIASATPADHAVAAESEATGNESERGSRRVAPPVVETVSLDEVARIARLPEQSLDRQRQEVGELLRSPEPERPSRLADSGAPRSTGVARASARSSPQLGGADPATDVEDLARRMAPALAREATQGEGATESSAAPEVTRELLEIYKEQQEIQSGKRGTIDDVLREAH